MAFRKATKEKIKLRMALVGPSGSGKTYSALSIATALGNALGQRVAVIDSEGKENSKDPKKEKSSVALYSHRFDFDYDLLKTYHPNNYIAKIKEAEEAGYGVIVIDSLTHAWNANEGALDLVAKEQIRNKSANNYTAWRHVTPLVNALVDTIIASSAHVIVTMRAKEKTVMEVNEKGRTEIKKVGLEAIMRDGMEYEFDIVMDIDKAHNAVVSKTRLDVIDGLVISKPGEELAKTLYDWLNDGEDAPEPIPEPAPKPKSSGPRKAIPASKVGTSDPKPQTIEQPDEATTEEEAPSIPGQNPEVLAFIETVEKYLEGKASEGNELEIIDSAREICGVQFQVENIGDIPVEKLDDLKAFMRGPLLDSLKKDGLFKGK